MENKIYLVKQGMNLLIKGRLLESGEMDPLPEVIELVERGDMLAALKVRAPAGGAQNWFLLDDGRYAVIYWSSVDQTMDPAIAEEYVKRIKALLGDEFVFPTNIAAGR